MTGRTTYGPTMTTRRGRGPVGTVYAARRAGRQPAPPRTGAGPGGGPARRRFNPATLAAVAVVAVVAGAGIALGLQLFGSPAASAPASQPSTLAPLQPGAGAQPGSGGQAGPERRVSWRRRSA